ncbi:hypothetical protein STEG23_002437, partial [Scotinomys teguina]
HSRHQRHRATQRERSRCDVTAAASSYSAAMANTYTYSYQNECACSKQNHDTEMIFYPYTLKVFPKKSARGWILQLGLAQWTLATLQKEMCLGIDGQGRGLARDEQTHNKQVTSSQTQRRGKFMEMHNISTTST